MKQILSLAQRAENQNLRLVLLWFNPKDFPN